MIWVNKSHQSPNNYKLFCYCNPIFPGEVCQNDVGCWCHQYPWYWLRRIKRLSAFYIWSTSTSSLFRKIRKMQIYFTICFLELNRAWQKSKKTAYPCILCMVHARGSWCTCIASHVALDPCLIYDTDRYGWIWGSLCACAPARHHCRRLQPIAIGYSRPSPWPERSHAGIMATNISDYGCSGLDRANTWTNSVLICDLWIYHEMRYSLYVRRNARFFHLYENLKNFAR